MGLGRNTWLKRGMIHSKNENEAIRPTSYPAEHEDSARAARSVSEGHAGRLNGHRPVALVCDWLTTPGGAEKVLLELHRMYPDAPIYTSQYSKKGIDWFNDAEVHTGWLQIFPKGLRKFLGPLRQIYFSHLDLSNYDLVISVTGAEAKSVRTRRHLCYCHVPTQYYWQMYDKYVKNPGFGFLNPLVRFFFKLLVKPLRKADYRAAQQPDQFITISSYAQAQIKKYYDRESVIVAPPVEIAKFTPKSTVFPQLSHSPSTVYPQQTTQKSTTFPQTPHQKSTEKASKSTTNQQLSTTFPQPDSDFSTDYFIIACRQVTWKRVDLAIKACLKAKLPLLVVGDGPEHANLLKLADNSPLIRFIPWAQTAELAQYLQGARGYIFPSLEPFGIAAVEALAAGCPVIAFAEGGSRDFIQDGKNGLLFEHQTTASLVQALQKFQTLAFDRAQVSTSAQPFDVKAFQEGIKTLVSQISDPQSSKPTASSKARSIKHKTSQTNPKGHQ